MVGRQKTRLLTIANRLRDLASDQGRLVIATAYGDWTVAATAARELRRRQIEPRLVLAPVSGSGS